MPNPATQGQSPVNVWEEPLEIPTYRVDEPDRAPVFGSGRAYQGVKSAIYPYPILEQLTDIREARTYRAVYLENPFLKLCVLPEIGGRIFWAVDKTNGYDFFYHQHVVKPALVGMLGAWICGGVEWNVPHHHRATTFMPVDYTLEERPDGSKTIWVGETELRHRMRWSVGLTLYPNRSYLEAAVRLFNRTPLAHSFLCFTNFAVHANQDYQVIFPPRTQIAAAHGKGQFSRWPVSRSVFDGVDYTRGVDVSWWKNHPAPISWFGWHSDEDFFGGYDHGRRAGVVHVADHHVVPGKKFWEWGTGPEGAMWHQILTETDGPYLELLAGAYSDNLPDYTWIQPYETKTWKQYWYPLRGIGGVKNANVDAAVNLEVGSKGVAGFGFNATGQHRGAQAVLEAGGQVLVRETIDIGPDKPYWKEIPLPAGIDPQSLKAFLLDPAGKELVGYSPVKLSEVPTPEPVNPPPAPQDVKTIEELYLTGVRLEQFYSPAMEPYPYYEEALRRDPGDTRVNTELGILYCQRGMFREAEGNLATALRRLTYNHTNPRNGEASYYLGVALEGQGKYGSAYGAYFRATWSAAWSAAAYCALARLAARKADSAKALELVEASLATNGRNSQARNLRAAMLRRQGDYAGAARTAREVLAADPLDFWAGNELYLAQLRAGEKEDAGQALRTLTRRMRDETQSYLEVAADYGNAGLWDDAIELLTRFVNAAPDKARVNPMIYYYLAYYSDQLGKHEEASNYCRLASQAPSDYCFPFRLESIAVLRRAMEVNPLDARAPYYLGNLLYDLQPQEAIRTWEKARAMDDSLAMVHRNLGLAYWRIQNDLPAALKSLERAVALDPSNPRFTYELDVVSEAANVPPERRLERLEENQTAVLRRDDAVAREVRLYVLLGQYDQALAILTTRHFHAWEGGGEIHDVYVDAHLRKGERLLRQGQYRQVLSEYEAARAYPQSLEVGEPYREPHLEEIAYHVGLAQEALGERAARQSFEQAAAAPSSEGSENRFYQGLALLRLGRREEANRLFDGLVQAGKELEARADLDYFAKFGDKPSDTERLTRAHYLQGLGFLGKGQSESGKREFQKVLAINASHLGARARLAALA
jgi:tetratricopeptide (TPR) repeat protein